MKKYLIMITILLSTVGGSVNAMTIGEYVFNPITFCVVPGGVAYAMTKNNQAMIAGAACAVGALLEIGLHSAIKDSSEKKLKEEISDLKNALKERETLDALRASQGEDETFSIKVRERVPGYVNERGEAVAPTIREKLIMPGNGVMVGD